MATAVSPHSTATPTDAGAAPPSTHTCLSDLRLGTSARVIGLQEDTAEDPISKRLSNLGFVPGRTVTPLRRAPLGDPVVYRVADYELCLRRHEARIVRVETIAETDDAGTVHDRLMTIGAALVVETVDRIIDHDGHVETTE